MAAIHLKEILRDSLIDWKKDTGRECHNGTRILFEIGLREYLRQILQYQHIWVIEVDDIKLITCNSHT